ncbi:MAG: molybdate ABC transporter permease subunit, partial [Alphaproteobacteria bacterium]
FRLAFWTVVWVMPFGILFGRWLAVTHSRARWIVEGMVALPLVLPPTVLGFFLLVALGSSAPPGRLWAELFGRPLAFSFEGLVVASVLFNLPFAVQPMQRALAAIDPDLRAAAASCGMSSVQAFLRVELPLAWPGLLAAVVLTFAHTLGEFGVVLIVGGAIPGETRTAAIAIYDSVQAFDFEAATRMSLVLLLISLVTIAATSALTGRGRGR